MAPCPCRHPGKVQTTPAQLATCLMNLIQFWVLPLLRLAFWRRMMRRTRGQTEEWKRVQHWRIVLASHPHPPLPTPLQETLGSLSPQVTCYSRFVFVYYARAILLTYSIKYFSINLKTILIVLKSRTDCLQVPYQFQLSQECHGESLWVVRKVHC